MRRDITNQQEIDRADKALRSLVRLLAYIAAHETLATAAHENEKRCSSPQRERKNHAE